MPGLVVTIGGKLGSSYQGAMTEAVALAQATNRKLNSASLKAAAIDAGSAVDMSRLGQFKQWKKEYLAARTEEARLEEALRTGGTRRVQSSTDAAYDSALIRANGLIRVRVAQIAAERAGKIENDIEAKASYEKLQNYKKLVKEKSLFNQIALNKIAKEEEISQMAMLTRMASGHAASGGGHGGGMTGIIRESLVVGREISMGRGLGRIGGSVTLLAQYLGILKLAVKSTATEAVEAADKEEKLGATMAIAAIRARGTAEYTNLLAAAEKQDIIVKNALIEKTLQLKVAQVTLNPVFFITAAILAVTIGAIFALTRSVKRYMQDVREMHDILDTSKTKFEDEASAIKKAADAAREFQKELAKLNEFHNQAVENSDAAVDAIKRESEANKKLADEKKQASLLDIEYAEKRGQISSREAAKRRGQIEKQSVSDAAASELSTAKKELDQRATDSANAIKAAGAAENAAQVANDRLNKSPESLKRLAQLDAAERKRDEANEIAKQAEKQVDASKSNLFLPALTAGDGFAVNMPGGGTHSGSLNYFKDVARAAQANVEDAKNALTPDENAAMTSSKKAGEASSVADSLQKAVTKALVDYNALASTSGAQVAAQQANIDKQTKISQLGSASRNDVTSRERIGLGAASSMQVSLLNEARQTRIAQMASLGILRNIDKQINENGGNF
jgi:hypothetical protein